MKPYGVRLIPEKEGMTYPGQAKVAGIIAIGLLVIAAFAVVAIFLIPIPAGNESLIGQVVGTIFALLGIVVAFFYGTSTGNRKDSETIANLAQTAKTVAQTASPNDKPEVTLKAGQSVSVEAENEPKAG